MSQRDILIRPVISEKAYQTIEDLNAYTFVVDPRANKTQIKQAVQSIFDVKVMSVNTINRQGKRVRRGVVRGQKPHTKRAVVTLAEGDSIDIFEV